MPVTVTCIQCGVEKSVIPAREKTFKFCSYACRSEWRTANWSGENNPLWSGGERTKTCQHCGASFSYKPGSTVTIFRKQKFCCKPCADAGGLRYFGPENGHWNGNPRRKHRDYKHAGWAKKVINRDKATCQKCGATGIELHAHHIKEYADYPDLRWDLDNGLTVCFRCHWQIHSASAANGVNSGEPVATLEGVAGNPEPSFGRKPVEGVTTRGRAYRRWDGPCEYCGGFISRRWSDVAGRAHVYCSTTCAARHRWVLRRAA